MRTLKTLVVGVSLLLFLAGCDSAREADRGRMAKRQTDSSSSKTAQMPASAAVSSGIVTSEGGRSGQIGALREGGAGGGGSSAAESERPQSGSGALAQVSLTQAEQSVAQEDRKIIRNAELTLQAKAPESAQRSLEQIAESLGGFVVSSELSHSPQVDGTTDTSVDVVLRIPSLKFADAIATINRLDGKIIDEKVSGEDVTEEYIDLDARLRSKKALEAQFLEIMKQAKKVSDALEVESELGEVRTQIEQIEGRKRFLDNKSSLSTITVHLRSTAPVVTASKSGFIQSLSLAFGDCVNTGAAIITGFIRFLGVVIPVSVLILLPIFLVLRFLVKRFLVRPRTAEPIPGTTGEA
ncbi:MAG: DUF4349 domain-containing protein [Blastocatellia bacterium]